MSGRVRGWRWVVRADLALVCGAQWNGTSIQKILKLVGM